MLSVIYAECHCHYAECHYAQCRKLALYAECRYTECHYAECLDTVGFTKFTTIILRSHLKQAFLIYKMLT